MTSSVVTTATTHVAPSTDNGESLTPFDNAVTKVMEQADRPQHEAVAGVRFIEEMAAKARSGSVRPFDEPGVHHLTGTEMDTLGYDVMEQIMVHGEPARPGSAHAAVEAFVLRPGESSLIHDNPSGEKSDCQVKFSID